MTTFHPTKFFCEKRDGHSKRERMKIIDLHLKLMLPVTEAFDPGLKLSEYSKSTRGNNEHLKETYFFLWAFPQENKVYRSSEILLKNYKNVLQVYVTVEVTVGVLFLRLYLGVRTCETHKYVT